MNLVVDDCVEKKKSGELTRIGMAGGCVCHLWRVTETALLRSCRRFLCCWFRKYWGGGSSSYYWWYLCCYCGGFCHDNQETSCWVHPCRIYSTSCTGWVRG